MRKRRLTIVFFGLSLAFLLLPSFRWALEVSLRDRMAHGDFDALEAELDREREVALPATQVTALLERATRERDPHLLAFVAVVSSSPSEALRAADQVYALDPSYAWVGYYLLPIKQDADANTRWLAHLQAFDPQNGVVYVAEAACIEDRQKDFPRWLRTPQGWKHPDPTPLVPQTEWLAAMEKAYAAPHYHGYEDKRFLLERDVMRELGRATPWKMSALYSDQRYTNFLPIRNYAVYKIYYLGENASRAHRFDAALQQVQQTAAFGQHLETEGGMLMERLMGQAIDNIAADGHAELLQAQGRKVDAELITSRRTSSIHANVSWNHSEYQLEQARTLDMVYTHLLSYLYVALGVLTLLALVFVLLRRDGERWFDRLAGAAAKAGATGMLATALILWVTYLPFALNFRDYMETTHPNVDSFSRDVAPTWVNYAFWGKLSG